MFRKPILLALLAVISFTLFAQDTLPDLRGWHLKDRADHFYGISLDKAYRELKNRKGKPVIVAIIDSGIDTTNEDLKSVLWTNPGEIPGNGIDDDGNGYVDDVHGWNFLGNRNGRDLKNAPSEKARVYYRFKDRFEGRSIRPDSLSPAEKAEYAMWSRAAEEIKSSAAGDQGEMMMIAMITRSLKKADSVIRQEFGKPVYSDRDLLAFQPADEGGRKAKLAFLSILKVMELEPGSTNTFVLDQLDEAMAEKKGDSPADSALTERSRVIRDDYYNISDRFYGNPDVMGPSPMHGTHVAGIIAADRNNGIGVDGIATNVKVMMIRAVPDGDEYDKDIVLAIRYAVDNGAKVINMSFGKYYSPEKKWVDEAVRYAESKDVLLVHAAGNESNDVALKASYPSPLTQGGAHVNDWITVGASGDPAVGNHRLVAEFSNYGAGVDVLAPGVKIYSTLPGEHNYGFLSGTSMAAPVVTGVAALIRSYFPNLSARQVKRAIEQSVYRDSTLTTQRPGSNETVPLKRLADYPGFVNAASAIEAAAAMKPEGQAEATLERERKAK